MSGARTFSGVTATLFGAVLGLSLAIKLAAGAIVEPRESDALNVALKGFLERGGFRAVDLNDGPEPRYLALSPTCRMIVTEVRPQGWNASAVRRLARPEDKIIYVEGGRLERDLSTPLNALAYHAVRFAKTIGIPIRWRPVLAVIAAPGCDVAGLPWDELVPASLKQ